MLNLDATYTQLVQEIYKNFIFYIPKSYFTIEQFDEFPNETKLLLDRIIHTDDNLDFIYSSIELTAIMSKSNKLQSNCFKLIKLKTELDEASFSYFSEKYLKELQTYSHIANLLCLYFNQNSPNKSKNTRVLFDIQNLNFNNHLIELKKVFVIEVYATNSENVIQEVMKTDVFKKYSVIPVNKEKYFRDFISHEKNSEIETIILKQYSTIKGKKLRYIIEFLIKKEVLTITYGTQTELYDSLKRTFNSNIGTYPSIFGYKINENKNSDYSRISNELEIILKQYF